MRLKLLTCVICLALVNTACTIEQNGAETKAEFHEPFTTQNWIAEQHATANGQNACTISSGYGGLTFVVRPKAGGHVVSVQSNRQMRRGTILVVTVNGHRYETTSPTFSAKNAVAMVEDFSVADKAYAEWAELKYDNGRSRYTAIYKLAGFKQKMDECMR